MKQLAIIALLSTAVMSTGLAQQYFGHEGLSAVSQGKTARLVLEEIDGPMKFAMRPMAVEFYTRSGKLRPVAGAGAFSIMEMPGKTATVTRTPVSKTVRISPPF